ncbi:hypothetical protein SFRURICE_010219, partial [Spodoptera frugiperda]
MEVSRQRIGDQRRAIVQKKLLPQTKIDQIYEQVRTELQITPIRQQHSTITHVTPINNTQPNIQPGQRMKWTNEYNETIMKIYYKITYLETNKTAYRKTLHEQFITAFPELSHITEQRLSDQVRAIINNKYINVNRLAEIKKQVSEQLLQETDTNQHLSTHSYIPEYSDENIHTQPIISNTHIDIHTNNDTIGLSQSFITETHTHTSVNSNTRLRWTDDINEAIIREYFRITHIETNRTAYRKPLHTIITQKFPNIAHVSEQRIADQRRVIINNRLISDDRLEEIKREVRDNLNIQTIENTQYDTPHTYTIVDSNNQQSSSELNETIPHTQDNTQIGNAILQDETTNTVFADETLDTKITNTFEDTYNKYLHTDPTKRPYIPKQKTSKKLAYIIAYLNNTVLPKYGSVEDDFLKTHALVYCAAHTAALCN